VRVRKNLYRVKNLMVETSDEKLSDLEEEKEEVAVRAMKSLPKVKKIRMMTSSDGDANGG
jgi:hypothetical protein